MKIVFDTNIYIAEFLTDGGGAERAVQCTVRARWKIYVSEYLLDEFERTLVGRLHESPRFAAIARAIVAKRSTLATLPSSRHVVPADPKDDPILQTALVTGADYLVSIDAGLLSLDPYEKLRIVSLTSYFRLLEFEGLL